MTSETGYDPSGNMPDRPASPHYSATLLPQRSLSRKGFIVLMLAVILISALSGVAFVALGAWPVTGFFGLDVLLVYLAFRLNYRAARLSETIELDANQLTLTRKHPSGRCERWSFNPYWVRFDLERKGDLAAEMSLTSHGKRLVFGRFLGDDDKEAFAAAFRNALAMTK